VRAEFTHEFIDAIDPAWPRGVKFCHDVIDNEMTEFCQAFHDTHGPLCAWGVIQNWDRVGSGWLLFDKRAPQYIFCIVREVRNFLGELEDAGFKRIQGEIHESAPTLRFASFFGFEKEGVLRNYGLGGVGNYAMVARIFDA